MENSLPTGWVETELGNYIYLKNGYAYKTNQFRSEGIPILKISGITKEGSVDLSNTQFVDNKDLNPSFIVKKGDIVIAMSGATTGKYGIYESDELLLQNQRVGNIKLHSDQLGNKRFVYYLIGNLKTEIEDRAYGGAQPNISPALIESIKICLPPLPEQERIVAKLDKLFAQHEKIKKALDRIPQLLKSFRQQVLTQAVTGKLTEQWREGKELEEWKNEKAQDCCLKVQSGGTPKGSKFTSSGIPFLKVYNIVNNKIDFDSEPQYVSEEIHTTQIKKSIAYPGDVIMNIVGPPLNKIAMLTNQYPEWNLNQAITFFRVKDYLNNKFLYYFFCEGASVRSLGHDLRGVVGQANISLSQCRNFDIPIPSLQEQREIVRRVESLFAKADAIESRYQTVKAKIDSLPQAILRKAFKGELVPQLPTDGDAKDLLAEILTLKEEVKGRKE